MLKDLIIGCPGAIIRMETERFDFSVKCRAFHTNKCGSFRYITAKSVDLCAKILAFKNFTSFAQLQAHEFSSI